MKLNLHTSDGLSQWRDKKIAGLIHNRGGSPSSRHIVTTLIGGPHIITGKRAAGEQKRSNNRNVQQSIFHKISPWGTLTMHQSSTDAELTLGMTYASKTWSTCRVKQVDDLPPQFERGRELAYCYFWNTRDLINQAKPARLRNKKCPMKIIEHHFCQEFFLKTARAQDF
ncbi:hypothetical protein ACOTEK_19180 [Achromobacter xylosoxidans]|uniref:hypothetical protein n=3 Tax=Alcaligenes xylosoxydans xylosoxydans TaxID=85698 RepID=UPI000F4F684A|nr:hypothetical protein [Achromobacter xylosoxidans]WPQ33997.1 hypothetical protein SLH34_25750 [Achromobacter xylosoxidans]